MRILPFVFLLLMGMSWRCVRSTCVFETDFGLSINCGLKKSGMFRVRNLGGLKGYVGLGIQLADELGFKESLSSLEQNSKRRSVNGFPAPGSFEPLVVPQSNNRATAAAVGGNNQDRSAYAKMNGRTGVGNKPTTVVPPFRPLTAAATNNAVRNVRLAAQQQPQQQQQPLLKPLPVPAFAALPESIAKVAVETPQPQPQPPQRLTSHGQQAQTLAVVPQMTLTSGGRMAAASQVMQPLPPAALMSLHQPVVVTSQTFVPQQQQQQASPVYHQNAMEQAAYRRYNGFAQSPQNSVDVRPIIVMPTVDDRVKQPEKPTLSNEVDPASMVSLFNVAAANNVSVERLAMALRHQQHRLPQSGYYSPAAEVVTSPVPTAAATKTTTTTPPAPPPTAAADVPDERPPVAKKITVKPHGSKYSSGHKVMNAPKEYYPVGYDKNFDDNFASKVDLPDTSFGCGDQKHFPGLYGDEDLGCMVFHVCAFTDDGLTQKSFLCPESTLFDQTILKCNWWFYVDCKSSRKLYDSNIPISKSYQLMKALTFFSSYSAGPSVDVSLAAATAAVSDQPSKGPDSAPVSSPVITNSTKPEVLDQVSLRR